MRFGWILLLLVSLLTAACSSHPSGSELGVGEAEYYQKAQQQLDKKHYVAAVRELKDLQARFPYSDYAEQAQLDLMYAHYQTSDYAKAAATAQSFLANYPTSTQLDYALYLHGLSNYQLTGSAFDRLFKRGLESRDLAAKKLAFNSFSELVSRFPNSAYAPDARSRMVYIRQLLADQNLLIARYYAEREAFIASVNRAQRVVQQYQGTESVEEALAIMSRCYTSLGQTQLAAKSRDVLAYNWPDSDFLNRQNEVKISWWPREKSWLQLLTFDLF